MPPSRRGVVSLFSGAGGLDLGLEAAGWNILAQVEMDADAVATLRHQAERRRSPGDILQSRIEELDPAQVRRSLSLDRGELALLAGGPPCQPFTTSGLRRALYDPRASSLFPAYLEWVREFQPAAIVLENVDGLLSAALRHRPLHLRTRDGEPMADDERKGSFLRWLLAELTGLGYSVTWGVAESADYGVPQMRQRALLIGVRGSEPCYLPPPTHGDGLEPYRTVGWALRDVVEPGPVQPLSERKKAVYRLVPPGGNWRDLPDDVRQATMGRAYFAEGGKSGWWRRLSFDRPAPTILGMPDHSSTALVHPNEVRCLSVNECAAIQTFPAWARFAGTSRSQYQQIGNAVPPVLGQVVGEHIARFLDGERLPVPAEPAWKHASANRRIGTHGWAIPYAGRTVYHLHVRVRDDHIWARGEAPEAAA